MTGQSPPGKRSTRAAMAPRAKASATKAWPSARSPLKATKTDPGPASRLSTTNEVTSGSLPVGW